MLRIEGGQHGAIRELAALKEANTHNTRQQPIHKPSREREATLRLWSAKAHCSEEANSTNTCASQQMFTNTHKITSNQQAYLAETGNVETARVGARNEDLDQKKTKVLARMEKKKKNENLIHDAILAALFRDIIFDVNILLHTIVRTHKTSTSTQKKIFFHPPRA